MYGSSLPFGSLFLRVVRIPIWVNVETTPIAFGHPLLLTIADDLRHTIQPEVRKGHMVLSR